MGFGSVKDGLYIYIWAQDPSGKCQIFVQAVEFYSGGLWFQVTPKSIYWFDPTTKRFGELSPQSINTEAIPDDILLFIPRQFEIAKPVSETKTAE